MEGASASPSASGIQEPGKGSAYSSRSWMLDTGSCYRSNEKSKDNTDIWQLMISQSSSG
jgi:hypothetical protein